MPNEPIYDNKNIMIGGKHIFQKTWFDKKICLKSDLLDFRGNFYTYNEFITIYDVKTNFLEYHEVLAAVKHWLQRADIPFLNSRHTQYQFQLSNWLRIRKVQKNFTLL